MSGNLLKRDQLSMHSVFALIHTGPLISATVSHLDQNKHLSLISVHTQNALIRI